MGTRTMKRTIGAGLSILGGALLASGAQAMPTIDGKLDAANYSSHYEIQVLGDGGNLNFIGAELFFHDDGTNVSFYVKLTEEAKDNTYGQNPSDYQEFKKLYESDKLIMDFGSNGDIVVDYLAINAKSDNPSNATEFRSCGVLNKDDCEAAGVFSTVDEQVDKSEGSAGGGFDANDFVAGTTSLDYNINNAGGFVQASSNGFTDQERLEAVTNFDGADKNAGESPESGKSGALNDPDDLWLNYVGYEFQIDRSAFGLGSGDTFQIADIVSIGTHVSPAKPGYDRDNDTCIISNGCATEVTDPGPDPDPNPDVPEPGTLVLFASALLFSSRRVFFKRDTA